EPLADALAEVAEDDLLGFRIVDGAGPFEREVAGEGPGAVFFLELGVDEGALVAVDDVGDVAVDFELLDGSEGGGVTIDGLADLVFLGGAVKEDESAETQDDEDEDDDGNREVVLVRHRGGLY